MVQPLAPELTEDELQFCSNAMLVHTWPNPYKINLMQLYLWHEKIPVHPSWNIAHNIGLTNDKKYWLQVLGSWMLGNKLYPNNTAISVRVAINTTRVAPKNPKMKLSLTPSHTSFGDASFHSLIIFLYLILI